MLVTVRLPPSQALLHYYGLESVSTEQQIRLTPRGLQRHPEANR